MISYYWYSAELIQTLQDQISQILEEVYQENSEFWQ